MDLDMKQSLVAAARAREPDGHLSERGDVDSEGSKSDSSQSSGIERWEG